MYRPPVRMLPNHYQSRVLLYQMKRWPQPRRVILRCKVIKETSHE